MAAATAAPANPAAWGRQTSEPTPWERQGSQDPFHCGTNAAKECVALETKPPAVAPPSVDQKPAAKIYRADVIGDASEDFSRQLSQEPFHCQTTIDTQQLETDKK
eukprot:TRINITY_DN2703_c0_g1_i1.p2 TRINITY_DN2703_c0_g1~~TRINITY_DN2703_c0_g1_i1.p2  ORF type:complete len:105 (+),score=21.74 TRINITY_DN2703_c0_g1_i1:102-416(+)